MIDPPARLPREADGAVAPLCSIVVPSYNGKTAPGDLALAQGHNTLLSFKSGPDVQYGEMIVVPKLAERWEVSPDGTVFTFHLRRSAKFANLPPVNGRELTADDVKWTFAYYGRTGSFRDKKLPESAVGFMYEGMVGVETPDQYTVVARFQRPFLPFLSYAASDWNAIVPRDIYEQQQSKARGALRQRHTPHSSGRGAGTRSRFLRPEASPNRGLLRDARLRSLTPRGHAWPSGRRSSRRCRSARADILAHQQECRRRQCRHA